MPIALPGLWPFELAPTAPFPAAGLAAFVRAFGVVLAFVDFDLADLAFGLAFEFDFLAFVLAFAFGFAREALLALAFVWAIDLSLVGSLNGDPADTPTFCGSYSPNIPI